MYIITILIVAFSLIYFFIDSCSAAEPKIWKCIVALLGIAAFVNMII